MFIVRKKDSQYYFPQDGVIGAWEWRSIKVIKESIGYAQYTESLKHEGFNHLYFSINEYIDIYESPISSKEPELRAYKTELADLIRRAKSNGIQITALAGSKDWATTSKMYLNDLLIDFVFNFHKEFPQVRFQGMQFDIEPYLLNDFSSHRESYLLQYLGVVNRIKERFSNSSLRLSFVIPYWWNRDAAGSVKVTFDNQTTYIFYHLVRLLENTKQGYLAIMNYRNYLYGKDGLIKNIFDQIQFLEASNSNVKLYIGIETGKVQPSKVTFYGSSKSTVKRDISLLLENYDKTNTVKGFIVHDFENYSNLKI